MRVRIQHGGQVESDSSVVGTVASKGLGAGRAGVGPAGGVITVVGAAVAAAVTGCGGGLGKRLSLQRWPSRATNDAPTPPHAAGVNALAAIVDVVGKDTIDRWAAEDQVCRQYA